jgi:predicted CXXCH cytochrome family protein
MSKIKLGFSAFLTLLLLSMFAALASAAGFTPTPSNPAPNIHVGTIDNNGDVNQHRTHGNFQNNTNSCANCHSTHNGEDAALLMKDGEFDLCMSCHDGTMGFYNVTTASEAGIFSDPSHLSASMHNVSSGIQLAAAPGAFNQKITTATLECSSCHNPHGTKNDRLLNDKVAGKTFGYDYQYTLNGYEETIVKLPLTGAAIDLDLVNDPAYDAINNASGLSGLKITKSKGPVDDPTHKNKLNYSEFCSACHDDYLQHSGTARNDGHYTHTTSSAKEGRSCIACHYAHGTDISTLKDTAGKTIADLQKPVAEGGKGWSQTQATDYMKDISAKGSSLKKFTNMAVCWACHQSTHKIDTPVVPGGNYSGKILIK